MNANRRGCNCASLVISVYNRERWLSVFRVSSVFLSQIHSHLFSQLLSAREVPGRTASGFSALWLQILYTLLTYTVVKNTPSRIHYLIYLYKVPIILDPVVGIMSKTWSLPLNYFTSSSFSSLNERSEIELVLPQRLSEHSKCRRVQAMMGLGVHLEWECIWRLSLFFPVMVLCSIFVYKKDMPSYASYCCPH